MFHPKKTSRICHRCGVAALILVDVSIEQNSDQGEITTSTFVCSDEVCRKRNDDELDKMVKKRLIQEEAHMNRLKKIQSSRKKK